MESAISARQCVGAVREASESVMRMGEEMADLKVRAASLHTTETYMEYDICIAAGR